MSAATIVVALAGTKIAVRVVPPQSIDHDRAFPTYRLARSYADGLWQLLGDAQLDDQCENWKGGARG